MIKKLTKMTKVKAIIYFVISLLVVAAMGFVVYFGLPFWGFLGDFQGSGKAEFITRGLDIDGGVSITFEVEEKDFTEEQFSDTLNKLEERVQQFSTEATAYSEGDNRITVEIPGQKDAQAVLDELGKPGAIYFATLLENGAEPSNGRKTVEATYNGQKATYEVWLDGSYVVKANGDGTTDETTKQHKDGVNIQFNDEGRAIFSDMTTQYEKRTTYVIYNDEVISAPTVDEPIPSGECSITGSFTKESAERMASFIRIGRIDLKLKEMGHKVVGASLGDKALEKSVTAGIIGIAIIMLILLVIYRIPGFAASLALLSYVEIVLLMLNGYDVTLTLPGIAGVVLGIGMAVDANVIIYARIREEIANGKTVKSAISIGFKKATSAIVDGNITTFIAAIILIWRGSGTVRGFGQTLAIGIAVSMFTALVISRFFVWMLYYMGLDKVVFYGKEKVRKSFDFIGKKVICIAFSCILVIIGIAAMIVNSNAGNDAFYFSIEFAGGTTTTVDFEKEYTIDDFHNKIKPALAEVLKTNDIQGQRDIASKKFDIKTPAMTEEQFSSFKSVLIEKFNAIDSKDNFNDVYISGTISNEMRKNAVLATVIATICMLIYIWLRFKNIKFAGSAVIALIHDVLIVVCFYAVSRTIVGTNFIACLLTIVGYSINATIVIFDRIRENKANMKRTDSLKDIVNLSITQTLTRSILTSLTTFVMVFVIFIMGVSAIQDFTLPLMVGIVIGAYSSVFLTGSIWYMFTVKKTKSVPAKNAAVEAEDNK